MAFISKAIDNMGKNPKYIIAYVFVLAVIVALIWFGYSQIKKITGGLKEAADNHKELDKVESETGAQHTLTRNEAEKFISTLCDKMGWWDDDEEAVALIRNGKIRNEADCVFLNQVWADMYPKGFDPNGPGDNYATWQAACADQFSSSTIQQMNQYLKSINVRNENLIH